MKKNIIFIALMSIFACTKDKDEVNNDNFAQNNIKDWFNTSFKNSEEWKQNSDSPNKVPDWSNGTYLKKDSIQVFEFPLLESKTTVAILQDKSLTSKNTKKILEATLSRMVIIKTETNEMIVRKLYYVPEYKYLLSKGYDISDVMIGKANDDFTGLLITKKWNDQVLSYHNVRNGKIEQVLVKYDGNMAKSNSSKSIRMNNYATARISGLGDEQNLDEVVINNTYQAPITYVYYPSQPYYPSTSPTYNPYVTGGGGSTISITSTESIAQSIEDNINPINLPPCWSGILGQLKNTSNNDIANVLTKLGVGNLYNVNMGIGELRQGTNYAETIKLSKNNYQITFSQDYESATTLFRAHAMLHELTHAYFISLADDYNTYPTNEPLGNYPSLYKIYVEKSIAKSEISIAEHEAMANIYVNAIAEALHEYDASYGVPSAFPNQVYTDLAWFGLKDTQIFKIKFPEGSADYIRMESRYKAEKNGVYSGGLYAVGKSCN